MTPVIAVLLFTSFATNAGPADAGTSATAGSSLVKTQVCKHPDVLSGDPNKDAICLTPDSVKDVPAKPKLTRKQKFVSGLKDTGVLILMGLAGTAYLLMMASH